MEIFLFAGYYLSFSKVGFIQKPDASCEALTTGKDTRCRIECGSEASVTNRGFALAWDARMAPLERSNDFTAAVLLAGKVKTRLVVPEPLLYPAAVPSARMTAGLPRTVTDSGNVTVRLVSWALTDVTAGAAVDSGSHWP